MNSEGSNYALLLDSLYSAAGDSGKWGLFLEQVARSLDAQHAVFLSIDPAEQHYMLDSRFGLSEDAVKHYAEYYGGLDPWYLAYKESGAKGWTGIGSRLCRPSVVEGGEFYNDYLRKYDARRIACVIIEHGAGAITALSTLRAVKQNDFGPKHERFLKGLAPHLSRARDLHRRMLDLERAAGGAASVVEKLDVGLLGLDTENKVCFANAMAGELLGAGTGLCLRDGRIVGRDPRAAIALEALWRGASDLSLEAETPSACTIQSGDRTLHITMSPFRISHCVLPGQMKVLVTITDLAAQPKSREQLFRRLFGITPAESRVIMLLLAGLDTKEIASRTGTTQNTVRFQLKAIYRKTGVTGQNQLVRLVSLLPGKE